MVKVLLRLYIVSLVLLASLGGLFAQKSDIVFENFNIQDGLSNNNVNCVFQDSKGFLWIGTSSGLNRYDGRRFIKYLNDPLDKHSLSNNAINDICEDKDGHLWIATENGLDMFNPANGEFTTYLNDEKNPNTIKNNFVFNVFVDSKGIVWIKTLRFLDKFDTKTNRIRHFEHYFDIFNPITEHTNFPIFEDSYGVLWVATNDGLNYFDSDLEQFVRFENDPKNPSSISNGQIRCIFEDSRRDIWIGTSNGFNRFNRKKNNFEAFYYQDKKLDNSVNAIVEDENEDFWLATGQNGLVKFDATSHKYRFYKHYNSEKSLSCDNVFSLVKDQSGILWMGTHLGISKLDSRKKKFNLYSSISEFRLSGNDITSILSSYNEDVIISTRDAGITIFNRQKKTVNYYSLERGTLPSNRVNILYKDNEKQLFAGTDVGLLYLSPKGKFENYFTEKNCLNFQLLQYKRVKALLKDSKGLFWIGTNQGLFKHNSLTMTLEPYTKNFDNTKTLLSNDINTIFETKSGKILIGTDKGLNIYNAKFNNFEKLSNNVSSGLLSHCSINSIVQDKNGIIWIGTSEGLAYFLDNKEGKAHFVTQKDGLPHIEIFCIIKFDNDLWLSTSQGILCYSIKNKNVRSYAMSDGLQGYEFNKNVGCISHRGEIFFGGTNGLNTFFPNSVEENKKIPNIAITSFVTYNEAGKTYHILGDKNKIILPHIIRSFTVEFAALEFSEPSQNKYKYYMDGLENRWIDLENRNYASFTNVPPGEYILTIKGSNSDGYWNEKGITIKIVIETPLWMNKWAYLFYILSLGLIIYGYIEMRTRTLRNANKILREKELAAIELTKQKEELSIKNQNIMDSITYAKRIQLAIMPSITKFKRLIPESFILYRPKDIVSGDFYWITEIGDKLFIAAVDCTGHGVPGAFMSIIGYDLLRNITKDRGIHRPSEVLDLLNKMLIDLLTKNNVAVGDVKDGMDISLCVFHKSKGVMEFAGALNPLYLIRHNKIITVKGDRYSVGLGNEHPDENFKNHSINLQLGDRLYIFSDGYSDQFGGNEAKKMKYRRFRHLLLSIHDMPFEQQYYYLNEHFENWKGVYEQVDDILVIGMSFDYYIDQIPTDEEV